MIRSWLSKAKTTRAVWAGVRVFPKPLFMRLFFVALPTRFSAVLLPVTERRTYVLYYPLERTKRRVSMSGNGLAAHLALYAGCITNCIFRWLWDGGYDAWIAVYVGLSRTFGPEALFFLSALRCSYSRVQTSERNVFPGLWIRLTSLLQNVKFSNGWAFWHVRVTWI